MISSARVNATLEMFAAPVAIQGMITEKRRRMPGARALSLPSP